MYKKTIYSFDGTEKMHGYTARPEKYSHLKDVINSHPNCIPRGAGLSYCTASSGNEILSIDMTKFNRILVFDNQSGTIKVEAGIHIGDLISFIIQKGWYFNVIPGYPSITVGGCVAFNVHGKSQSNIGTFGDHIKELTLYHPSYGEVTCSNIYNKDIFDLTIGGFGLTGVILNVTLVLSRLPGNIIIRKIIKCTDLSDAVEKMISLKNENDYVYSWNNLNILGNHFGKGVIYYEKYTNENSIPLREFNYARISSDNRRKFIFNFINKVSTRLICYFYYKREQITQSSHVMGIDKCTFPIYGKEIYYYLFGRQGFREYQLIVPLNFANEFFYVLQNIIRKYHIPITLGSLKLFQGKNKYLNFCQDGVCLAIDVPANNYSANFFSEIDQLTIRFRGIANLSKDSRLSAKSVAEMYVDYSKFKNDILKFDPKKHFSSALRQRIEV